MGQSLELRIRGVPETGRTDRAWAYLEAYTAAPARSGMPAAQRRGYRTSLRKQIPFETLVNCGMTYSVPWNIINLGLGGALVGMDRTTLQIGATIEFELRFTHRGRRIEHLIPARIVRLESRGVALQFGDYDDTTYADLTNFLYDIEG